jgi:hypothetical protein
MQQQTEGNLTMTPTIIMDNNPGWRKKVKRNRKTATRKWGSIFATKYTQCCGFYI